MKHSVVLVAFAGLAIALPQPLDESTKSPLIQKRADSQKCAQENPTPEACGNQDFCFLSTKNTGKPWEHEDRYNDCMKQFQGASQSASQPPATQAASQPPVAQAASPPQADQGASAPSQKKPWVKGDQVDYMGLCSQQGRTEKLCGGTKGYCRLQDVFKNKPEEFTDGFYGSEKACLEAHEADPNPTVQSDKPQKPDHSNAECRAEAKMCNPMQAVTRSV
ncbi:hypothetical protein HRG_003186 [Hirsutella rhossiliensis]|uniref:Uncharacterized protein n=1 Tax=Hirsutella rhossiliensis TaxID=111463 RepID=A0A9P8N1H8_9HYPO|nr:uncharacterized protein HRG_03186 [Hirsutella rhossiliensis]KAH0965170.1 hypothetical protein HRG_03186 [Hirsutella rhossiliensis]